MSIIPVVLLSSYTFLARPRSMYICPRLIGHTASGHYLQVKLVGNLIHGHALVLHMVYPQVADDANLMCHCMDSSIEVLKTVRSAKGQPEYLPTNWRSQLDGVSTNWGSTSFAHHEYLHRLRVLGAFASAELWRQVVDVVVQVVATIAVCEAAQPVPPFKVSALFATASHACMQPCATTLASTPTRVFAV